MPRGKLTTDELVARYVAGVPMAKVAEEAGISRIGVWKRLKAAGVPTTRTAAPRAAVCAHCSRPFIRTRCRLEKAIRAFCGQPCYLAWIQAKSTFRPNRHGSRKARLAVSALLPLPPGAVVHHIDGDENNNALNNLQVFASGSAHLSHHRGGRAKPIWP